MKVKIKKLKEYAWLPKKTTQGAAAYDVCLPDDYVVSCGRQIIPLHIAIELPYGYEAKIEPRSGFSARGMRGMSVQQSAVGLYDCDVIVGKIDSDYRGNIGVIVNNRSMSPFWIPKGTRIAQMTIYKVEDAEFVEVDDMSETERGNGGFGHTGAGA